ncbi:hypothetical protein QT881_17575, partial [Xanthomonas fragariae]|nr:hypothetical protein [Xanthomonas fragariae]MDM7559335.1 hypothetical protein [Xanthomonas fragariae]MDM7573928.1 hypothetical protein [Xanthomonas fragariae]MDM7577012.1 hypothetical protein [Xanthomonas fragariae]MDM7583205.1 hypothetical protein [Xanthomonas fragariae]
LHVQSPRGRELDSKLRRYSKLGGRRNRQDVELATLDWVDWYNHKRLLGSIGNMPPAEAEEAYDRQQAGYAKAA